MKYLILFCMVFVSCKGTQQIIKPDTIYKTVINTVTIDDENLLRELDRTYQLSDSLYNELMTKKDQKPCTIIKVVKCKKIEIVNCKPIIDSLSLVNSRILREKTDILNKYKDSLKRQDEYVVLPPSNYYVSWLVALGLLIGFMFGIYFVYKFLEI